uniref:RING-type domain-containing protein n=1 Tax=Elaeophora elaphi TaxID=1147741 RepID=A0A0R3RZ72_9BILA
MGQLLGRLKSKGLCTICLEKMSVKDIFALHCGHLFHSQCIESWLIERETCPVCRKPSKLDDGVPSPHFDDDTSDRRSEISDTHSDDDSSGESESESERVDNCDDLRRQAIIYLLHKTLKNLD